MNLSLEYKCKGISWTYNEPTIWIEYAIDGAKIAKKRGLYTVFVTNGYIEPEALDAIGPYLDAYRVDIKGFDSKKHKEASVNEIEVDDKLQVSRNWFYRDFAKVKNEMSIFEAAIRAKWRLGSSLLLGISAGAPRGNIGLWVHQLRPAGRQTDRNGSRSVALGNLEPINSC